MALRAPAGLCACLLLLQLPAAAAESGEAPRNRHLERAKAAYAKLRYTEVLPKLDKALAVEGNTPEQLTEIYALKGTVYAILDKTAEADAAFKQLLQIDPDHELDPGLSPKILDAFALAKKRYGKVSVTLRGPPEIRTPAGEAASVAVGLEQSRPVSLKVEARVRAAGDTDYASVPMSQLESGRYTTELPPPAGDAASARDLEVYVAVLDAQGETLATAGSAASPLVVHLPAAEPELVEQATPIYAQWWVWAAVGAVAVVATGVIVTAVALSGGEEVPVGTLGEYTLD